MQQQFTHAPLLALLGTALGVAPALRGTTLEQLDLDELIHGSTAVVRAKVSGSTAVRRQNDVFTIYKLDVMEQWKSQPGSNAPLEVAVPGGVAGGIRQMVSGAPLLHPGEEYVLFLWQGRSGLIQLMGLSQGLFRVIRSQTGAEILQAPATDQMLDRAGHPVAPQPMRFSLSVLKARMLNNPGRGGE